MYADLRVSLPDDRSARLTLLRPRIVLGAIAVAALFIWPLLFNEPFAYYVGTMLSLYSIGAVSVHLIIRTGHVSLCQAAFMGVASYTSVIAMMKFGLPWIVAALMGIGASVLLGLIVAPIFLRLAGKYFVLVTFLFGEIVRMVFAEWSSVTGGANGISNIPPPAEALGSKFAYYYFALVIALCCILFAARLLRSEIGQTLEAIREDERLAACSGVPVLRFKVIIFAIACALIGIEGVVQAHYVRYLEPQSFGVIASLNLVVMNVIGGMYNLVGPLLGAVFVGVLPELLRQYVHLQHIIFGVFLIVAMAALPGGLVEIAGRIAGIVKAYFRGQSNGRSA
jgi:branched-chain amino acid transport system permease protein